ncbi:hypothetical protein F4779DRAFT_603139 [Xylariaceae sp. FL0662B]|nr:hypothetical protein F4779DRAFT_603139 [Xylariaceae sp. FL0662B]
MGSASNVDVALLSDEDIPTCFRILSKSFRHDAPFVDIYFPGHDTSSGEVQGLTRLTAWKHSSENSKFLKAVRRTDQGGPEHIIGLAIWTYMKDAPPADISKVEDVELLWPDSDDREFMARLWSDYVKPRTRAIEESGGKGIYVLEMLAVHPDFQRLGAGTALVKWGTRAADEQGLKAVVEGTPVARRLYDQCGLHTEVEEMRFDVGEWFTNRRMPKLIFMTREPQ